MAPDQVRDRLVCELAAECEHHVEYWPVFLLETGDHIGCCGLKPFDLQERSFELGFHMKRAHWGSGHAKESASRVIKYAFDELDVHSIVARHHPDNEGSRRILTNLGFEYTHHEIHGPEAILHPSYILLNR